MKRVLFISYAFPPLSIAGTFRPMRFVKYLYRHGWSPIVLTILGRDDIPQDPSLLQEIPQNIEVHHVKALGPSMFRIISNEQLKTDRFDKIDKYTKMRSLIYQNIMNKVKNMISIPDPLIYWIPPVVSRAMEIYNKKPFDAVITTSPPHSSHLAGMILSKRLNVKWIADFRDPWVDNIYFPVFKNKVRQTVEKWMEKSTIKASDKIIANTDINRDTLIKRYGDIISPSKVMTITNGFDSEYIDSIESKSFDKFTICHTGRFYSILDPYFFFDAFAQWVEQKSNRDELSNSIQLLIIGSGDLDLQQHVENIGIKEFVHFIPRVSHREAISYAKGADLQLVTLGFNNKAEGWIPLKLYDYIGCKKPILGVLPENSAAKNLICKTRTGYVVSQPDHKQIRNILDDLYSQFKNQGQKTIESLNEIELSRYEINNLTIQLIEAIS